MEFSLMSTVKDGARFGSSLQHNIPCSFSLVLVFWNLLKMLSILWRHRFANILVLASESQFQPVNGVRSTRSLVNIHNNFKFKIRHNKLIGHNKWSPIYTLSNGTNSQSQKAVPSTKVILSFCDKRKVKALVVF